MLPYPKALRGVGHPRALALMRGRSAVAGANSLLATIMRQVSNRVSFPQSINASFVQGRAGTQHWLSTPVNGVIEVRWPNYRVNGGEAGPTNGGCWEYGTGAALAGTAQITYTSRTTGLPVTVNMTDAVGGGTALSAASGQEIVALATIDMMPGTKIKPEFRGSFVNGVVYSQYKSDLAGGDFFEFATTVAALGSAPVQTFADTWYGPCMIRALSNKPAIIICGDSREDGIYDVPNTAHGDGGQAARLWGEQGCAYFNMGGRGDTAAEFAANTGNARRRALAALAGATAIELGLGINDFGQNRTAIQVNALNQIIATNFGVDAIWKTIDPFTNGNTTSPWSSPGNAERVAYNATVRGKQRYWDPAGVLEVAGGWFSAEAVATQDAPGYIHEANSGNKCAAATAAVVGTSLALHGIAPRSASVPPAIANLAATAQSQTDVLLAFTTSGMSHEYRLNGGPPVLLPSNKTVSGLTTATAYTVEVRGSNAQGASAWSNVANVTTQSGPLTTFDQTGAAAGVTFSEGNRRITTSSGNLGAKSTSSRSSGVQYAEFVIVSASGGFEVGLLNVSGILNGWMAQNLNCVAIDSASGQVFSNGGNQGSSGTGALTAGNVISIEYTQATGKVRFGKNGVWSGTTWNVPTGALFLAAQPGNGSIRIATEAAQFAYPGLAGSNAWN